MAYRWCRKECRGVHLAVRDPQGLVLTPRGISGRLGCGLGSRGRDSKEGLREASLAAAERARHVGLRLRPRLAWAAEHGLGKATWWGAGVGHSP